MQRCHSNSPSGWSFSGDVKLRVDIYFRLMRSVSEHPHIFSDLLAFLSKLCEDEKVGVDQFFGCQASLFPTIFGIPIMPSPIANRISADHRSPGIGWRVWCSTGQWPSKTAHRPEDWGRGAGNGREINGLRCLRGVKSPTRVLLRYCKSEVTFCTGSDFLAARNRSPDFGAKRCQTKMLGALTGSPKWNCTHLIQVVGHWFCSSSEWPHCQNYATTVESSDLTSASLDLRDGPRWSPDVPGFHHLCAGHHSQLPRSEGGPGPRCPAPCLAPEMTPVWPRGKKDAPWAGCGTRVRLGMA